MNKKIPPEILKKATDWSNNEALTAVLREEIISLLSDNNVDEIIDRFYKDLEFGTAGIRGLVGAGTNRLNIFNICKVTQGVSNYVKTLAIKEPSAVIGFDSRLSSVEFAKTSAQVLVSNGIKVHFFDNVHATPAVSFAVRYLKATLGIIITASHNPPEYNGYKIVWSNGCQVTSPHDIGIIKEVDKLSSNFSMEFEGWQECLMKKSVTMIAPDIDNAYLDNILSLMPEKNNHQLQKGIIYTPLHGVGYDMVNELMRRQNFNTYRAVPSQMDPDGKFPTLRSPNPEDRSSMVEAMKMANDNDYLILATDPDADRLGAMFRHAGEWKALNGNQIGQLLLYYWLNLLKKNNKLPKNGFVVSTLVTSRLGQKISESFGVQWSETLTGFKNIGKMIEENLAAGKQFLFAYEESHGYQFGDYIREKDGISACLMFAELFRYLDQKGQSINDMLDEIYQTYGYHQDKLINKVIPGKFGAEKINKIMQHLRAYPPSKIAKVAVTTVNDYQLLTSIDVKSGNKSNIAKYLKTNLISLTLENNTRCSIRPSGTEPKIKFYFNFEDNKNKDLLNYMQECIDSFLEDIEKIIQD